MSDSHWRTLLTILILAPLASKLPAQAIRISTQPLELPGLIDKPLGEPHLAVHPSNPNHLLGATMVHDRTAVLSDTAGRRKLRCATFVSTDGGATWVTHTFPIMGCFDPQVSITADGHAIFAALGDDPRLTQGDGLVSYHSTDGGLTWSDRPAGLGRGHDHPVVVADWSGSPRGNWLYIVTSRDARLDQGTLRFPVSVSRSRNGGRTFDPEVLILNNNLMHKAETPVVLSDGTLVVSYVEAALPDGSALLMRRRAFVARSSDGGHSFSRPWFVNEACGGPAEGFRLSALAVDASAGQFRDRLYFACNDPLTRAVMVQSSADAGDTWSELQPANAVAADTLVRRKVMAMAVNDRGVLGVAWLESRTENADCTEHVYFATSVDGGATFLPAQRVSHDGACALADVNGTGWAGDYFGIVTDRRGAFRLLWSGARGGLLQLHLSTIEVSSSG
jgi:hypothetical protein